MAYAKGEHVETGIWRLAEGAGYLAEINYTDPATGKRIRERKTTHRVDLAREWRQTRKVDALRGEIRRTKDRAKPIKFPVFADEYLEHWSRVQKRESSYIRDKTSVRRLTKTFGKKLLSEIARRDVENYLAERKVEGKAPATMNRELCCLKNMLRKAVDWGYVKENPAWGVKQQRENPPEFEFLTEPEMQDLVSNTAPHLQVLLTLAMHTGLRRGELFKLEWRDLGFDKGEKGMITVRDTKNHEVRYVPMNATVRDALARHPKKVVRNDVDGRATMKRCPYVFSGAEGEPLRDIYNGFRGALKRAGIERHIRFHDLRHTFASHLVMRGVDLRTVAKLLGHRDIKMTMRYAHLAPEHLQSAVDVLDVRADQEARHGTDG